MRIPMIFTLYASDSQSESGLYPAISANATILYDETEQNDIDKFSVDKVECTDFLQGKTETVYWLNIPTNETWHICITNRRITFENSYSKGVIGGAKVKSGRLTAGHLPFDSIAHLSAFFSKEGTPILLCSCYRQDGTKSAIVIHGNKIDTLRSLLSSLQEKIMTYLNIQGKLATAADVDQAKLDDAMRKWDEMVEKAWADKNGEYTATVLNKSYTQVPNSRS